MTFIDTGAFLGRYLPSAQRRPMKGPPVGSQMGDYLR